MKQLSSYGVTEMQVYWLERTESDLPPANDWLSTAETICLAGLRFAKRRDDWRLGRWTAKQAVASYLNLPDNCSDLARIEIRPAASGAPEAFVDNFRASATISLSHRNGRALCAVAPSGVDLGCDLEIVEPRSEAFVADYFTTEEQELIASTSPADKSQMVALFWSAKESALKALREGLRLDTRSVSVTLADSSGAAARWNPLSVRTLDGSSFRGWWRNSNGILRTLVANPSPELPLPIDAAVCCSDNRPFDLHKRDRSIKKNVSPLEL